MITNDIVEARLRQAVEAEPSVDGLRWLDGRVERAMARGRNARHPGSWRRRLLRPVPVIAALVLFTGAVAGALTLLERVATESGESIATAWEQAEVLGISQSASGYTVTLERAYADVNQVVTFMTARSDQPTASDAEEIGTVSLNGSLTDPSGATLDQPVGTGEVEADLSAEVSIWGPPAPQAGRYVLTITSLQAIPVGAFDGEEIAPTITGEWRFEFNLPEPAGSHLATDATAERDGAIVSMTDLTISPTMVVGRLYLDLEGERARVWVPTIESVRHDGELVSTDTNANFYGLPIHDPDATGFEFRTAFGAEIATGTWEFTISEIRLEGVPLASDGSALDPADPDPHMSGPWILTVDVP